MILKIKCQSDLVANLTCDRYWHACKSLRENRTTLFQGWVLQASLACGHGSLALQTPASVGLKGFRTVYRIKPQIHGKGI